MTSYRLLLCLALLPAACGLPTTADNTALDAEVGTVSDISMSLPALEAMDLPDGTAVIVPLDRNVLALDADALAALASEGDLAELLDSLVLEGSVGEADVVHGSLLRTVSGQSFVVVLDGDVVSIGKGTLVDLRSHNGVTLLIVDGLLGS